MNLIWLASYPKSGNTWVRMLVSHYSRGEIRAEHHDVGDYWYQVVSPAPLTKLALNEQIMLRGAAMAHLMSFCAVPTLVKTHHANIKVDGMPLFCGLWAKKVVYVVRDPRDVVASFQNHMGLETLDDSVEAMNRDRMIITQESGLAHILGSWSMHVKSWLESDLDPLLVRYEDLHADTAGQLGRILEHLGFDPDPERIDRAVNLCRFDRLKGRESEVPFPEVSKKSDTFFRKGQVGSYREELSPEQIETIEEQHGEVMRQTGYELTRAPLSVVA